MIDLQRFSLRSGTIGRTVYFLTGSSLLALKFAIDWSVAHGVFHRTWSPADYIAPGASLGLLLVAPHERLFYATMVLIALPFITCGVWMTALRLRSAGLPVGWTLLFFVPGVNFGMFALLTGLPPRATSRSTITVNQSPPSPHPGAAPLLNYSTDAGSSAGWLSGFLPANPDAAKAVAILLPVPIALAATFASVHFLSQYGWGVFVGVPFAIGLMASALYAASGPRTLRACIGIAYLSLTVYGIAMLLLAFEGAACLVMAAPLAYPIAIAGAAVGTSLRRRGTPLADAQRVVWIMLMFLPAFIGAERLSAPQAPVYAATTWVEVAAEPSVVWPHVIEFGRIPPPTALVFRTGIAYPIRATISGAGPGAVRNCVFSTGSFVEPIEVWDEPRTLRFAVTFNPPPMKEWSPYSNLRPPHLENFLVSERGEFKLTELPGGRTRLQGTTWYRHHMWPAAYWRLWSDLIIHRIHLRVLNHIKAVTEGTREAGD